MPFVSKKQRAYMEWQKGKKVPTSVVDKFEAATPKGAKLPLRSPKKPKAPKKPKTGY